MDRRSGTVAVRRQEKKQQGRKPFLMLADETHPLCVSSTSWVETQTGGTGHEGDELGRELERRKEVR